MAKLERISAAGFNRAGEIWLTDVIKRVGDNVEFSFWQGADGSVLLVWDAY